MSKLLKTIPLSQLRRSKLNIRKTGPLVEIEQMAASIAANGVLENLLVARERAANGTNSALYGVIAGGRRLAALRLLAKRKAIARDYPVPCRILTNMARGGLVEISLTENLIRAPVHPADQFDAFAALQKEGLSSDDIAVRFGLSELMVRQRLKLAAVSPRLMAEYRNDAMTLEQLMCFTVTDDHRLQEEVWFENPFATRSSEGLKRCLTRSQVDGSDRRARFVGAEAYEGAGGTVVRDLFQPEGEGYFTDSQLLDRLAAEKLQAAAETIRAEGWSWMDCALETDFGGLARFRRVPPVEVALPKRDERRLVKLSERYDELAATMEEEEEDTIAAEFEQVSAALTTLQAKKETWSDAAKHMAGAVVSLAADGTLHIVRGLVKGEPERPEERDDDGAANGRGREPASGYSHALLVELSAHRTAALREVLASKPQMALVALLHRLAGHVFFGGDGFSCLQLSPAIVELGKSSSTVGESKAAAALLERHSRWSERLPAYPELWGWLEALDESAQHELLAYCVALCVTALHPSMGGAERLDAANQLAAALSLDMAEWWRPTEANYFGRVTKETILAAVSDGVSAEAAHRLRGLKKSQMGHEAEKLLAEGRWLPEPLRTRKTEPGEVPTEQNA